MSSLHILSIFQRALQVYQNHFSLFIAISLMYGVLSEIIEFIFHRFVPKASFGIVLLIQILVMCWFSIALIHASAQIYRKSKKVSMNAVLSLPRDYYLLFVAVSLAQILVAGVGFQLLIIPGIFAATIFMFANMLVVLEKTGYLDSFRRSFQLVKDDFWMILLFNLTLVLIFGMIILASHLLAFGQEAIAFRLSKLFSIVLMPYAIIAQVGLYEKIRIKGSEDLRI